MAHEDLFGIQPKCVIDSVIIPPDRLRFKSVTCSKECGDTYAKIHQKKRDDKGCKYCHRPSSPNARRAFRRFRKWERENPELARPVEWEILAAAGVTRDEFSQALAQADRSDIEIDIELRNVGWDQVKKPRGESKPTPEMDRVLTILATYVPPTKEEVINAAAQDDVQPPSQP